MFGAEGEKRRERERERGMWRERERERERERGMGDREGKGGGEVIAASALKHLEGRLPNFLTALIWFASLRFSKRFEALYVARHVCFKSRNWLALTFSRVGHLRFAVLQCCSVASVVQNGKMAKCPRQHFDVKISETICPRQRQTFLAAKWNPPQKDTSRPFSL